MHREALGLYWLAQLTPLGVIPGLIFEDHTHHLLAMQAVPQPHANWKKLLLAGKLDINQVAQFATLLATIHSGAARRQHELAPIFSDRTFFESLRLEPYYQYTASQVPAAPHFLDQLVAATRERCYTLVHGDYSPKNTLVYANRLVLLDYEVNYQRLKPVGLSLTGANRPHRDVWPRLEGNRGGPINQGQAPN